MSQYPSAFEFNEFYLEFLAYHYVSNRFRTFLLDSEYERMQCGITPDHSTIHKIGSLYSTLQQTTTIFANNQANSLNNATLSNNNSSTTSITCIWEYIQKVHYNSPKFFNFYYVKGQDGVLKPSSAIENLKLWRYYTRESLCTGPIYDLDLIAQSNDDSWYPVPLKSAIDYYEDLDLLHPSQFEVIIKELQRGLKTVKNDFTTKMINSMGKPVSLISWKDIWEFFTEQVSSLDFIV